jgi:DNA-directed RNA polymerase III subunit RPC2
MIDDKWHARRKGARAILTRQPVEGRKRKGGLRIGEMERDCLIAAGASNMLLNLLCIVSDAYKMMVCPRCGLIASRGTDESLFGETTRNEQAFCASCENVRPVAIRVPYAWKLLCQEARALNICMHHRLTDAATGERIGDDDDEDDE